MRLDMMVRSADWQTWPPQIRHDVIAEVIKPSPDRRRGQLFAKYPRIPRDAADQRRKMKTGEIAPEPIH
jgi:hypothetical protein